MSDQISPKTHAAQVIGGGRHYSGRGLGPEPPWHCPGCGTEHHTPIAQGCARCLAEAQAQQAQQFADQHRAQVAAGKPAAPLRRALPAFIEQTKAATEFESILRRVLDEYAGRGVQVTLINDHRNPPDTRPVDPDDGRATSDLYAEYIGLQLILTGLQAGSTDPLLPSLDSITRRIAYLEAMPRMQEYFLTDPSTTTPDTTQENPK